MEALIGTILALIIVAVILYPFFRRSHSLEPQSMQNQYGEKSLSPLRNRIYQEMLTLKSDFEAGYLTEKEYETHFNELRVAAAATIRDEETQRNRKIEKELSIEREIHLVRQQKQGESDVEA